MQMTQYDVVLAICRILYYVSFAYGSQQLAARRDTQSQKLLKGKTGIYSDSPVPLRPASPVQNPWSMHVHKMSTFYKATRNIQICIRTHELSARICSRIVSEATAQPHILIYRLYAQQQQHDGVQVYIQSYIYEHTYMYMHAQL